MAEAPSGYFPDYKWQPVPKLATRRTEEIETALSGREQRRLQGDPRLVLAGVTEILEPEDRRIVKAFLDSKDGRMDAFYLWHPVPESIVTYEAGTVAAATSLVVPWKGPWWEGDTPIAATVTAVTVDGDPAVDFAAEPDIGTGGEDRISWTGAMSGAVLVTAQLVRLRLVVRNDLEAIEEDFEKGTGDVAAAIPLRFIQLI